MGVIAQFRLLNADQRNAFIASFLGWTLDAFDFFLLVFVLKDVAAEFHVKKEAVAFAITLTLACRPIGALLFGRAADRYGRRLPLMINIICYSVINMLCGFAPSLTVFLILRALFGVAMGGEWGLGAALAMESVPEEARGVLSGLLQEGYPVGYLLAALVYPLVFPHFGWRGMFFVGLLPALLSLFIRAKVKESPIWEQQREQQITKPAEAFGPLLARNAKLFCYLVLLMTAFTFMSHGTQDVYPTFLQVQHKFNPKVVSAIAITYNIGALLGGVFFGGLSERIGRRRAIVIASLLALPIVPLWAFSQTAMTLGLGAFLMQFMVQGAWGIIPAHLTELSPGALRSTFIGFAYQLGNLISSLNAPMQARIAAAHGENYGFALSVTIVVVLLAVALITSLGHEAKGASLAT